MMIEDIFSVGLPMILVTVSKENKFVFLIFDVLCAVTKVHSNVWQKLRVQKDCQN